MLQNKILILSLFFVFFSKIAEANFSASVVKADIAINESFELILKLENQEYLFEPKISFLNKKFYILSTRKSSQTTIINGKFNSNFSWIITLRSRKKGKINISPISISTKNGKFTTKSTQLNVTSKKKNITRDGVWISTKISNRSPFENEAINLSLEIYSKYDLYDVAINDFNIDGFIINNHKDIQSGNRNIKGEEVNFIQINYLITPIKSGKLKLNFIEITGKFIENNRARHSFNSIFDRVRGKRFAVQSDSISFNIKKPLENFYPWLPAENISIKENILQKQEFEVGKPISRKFTITTKGISITQIPQLLSNFDSKKKLKIYNNKPKISEEIIDNKITGLRVEEYTIIPQKSGKIELPEIKIKWWDTKNNKIRFAKIAKRTIEVKEGSFDKNKNLNKGNKIPPNKININNNKHSYISYITITLSLILNIILSIILFKKNKQKDEDYLWIKGKMSDIKKLTNVEELEIFIQRYVEKICNMKLSTKKALEFLSKQINQNNEAKNLNKIFVHLNQKIEKNKYGQEKMNLEVELLSLEDDLLKLQFTKKNKIKKEFCNEVAININP